MARFIQRQRTGIAILSRLLTPALNDIGDVRITRLIDATLADAGKVAPAAATEAEPYMVGSSPAMLRVFETIPAELAGVPVQAWLAGEDLRFAKIGE